MTTESPDTLQVGLQATELCEARFVPAISAEVYARIRVRAHEVLRPFTAADGTLPAPSRGHRVVARTPAS